MKNIGSRKYLLSLVVVAEISLGGMVECRQAKDDENVFTLQQAARVPLIDSIVLRGLGGNVPKFRSMRRCRRHESGALDCSSSSRIQPFDTA